MKAVTTLHVSAKYLFERIADKTLYDIFQTTGQELSLNELQGYSYLTKIDMYSEAQMELLCLRFLLKNFVHYFLK